MNLEQKSIAKRLLISVPLFVAAIVLLLWSQKDPGGFGKVWRYFSWSNQTLAVFTLWTVTVYLLKSNKQWILTLIPALFMTAVCSTYLFISPDVFGLSHELSYTIGVVLTLLSLVLFIMYYRSTITKDKLKNSL